MVAHEATPSALLEGMTDQQKIEWLATNKIWVVASYRQHFISWCNDNRIDHRHMNVKHVSSPEHLMGIRKVPLFLAYGWWMDRNLEDAVLDYCGINGLKISDLPLSIEEAICKAAFLTLQ